MKRTILLWVLALCLFVPTVQAQQHSVARVWNEALLEGIRNDFARPTVHARNLFHVSSAMYDAWAAYDTSYKTFFLGDSVGNYYFDYTGIPTPSNVDSARNEAISYACYRILKHRFKNSPGKVYVENLFDSLFIDMGYDTNYTSVNYASGVPAALGNYIAQEVIAFGFTDNANEQGSYANLFYQPVNQAIVPTVPGNPTITDFNRWQPITLDVYIDQSGNVIPLSTPPFLSPEWGTVTPFALKESDLTIYTRNGNEYWVYHDPGPPAMLGGTDADQYKWTFSLVAAWSGHLAPDSVIWDISPASSGNVQSYPTDIHDYPNFYDLVNGGDPGQGYSVNPATGQPYTPQLVPRGDYTRVLAEFWADGPDSETPPGHWFTIINYVNDHPQLVKRFGGVGPVLDDLEWDVKSYFILAGAVHDAAVAVWGMKGWYDYLRPVSAIRYMADKGQSSDTSQPRYHVNGIPLIPDIIERVAVGDPLAGPSNEHVGKFKVRAWRGPDYINDPLVDEAGVDWILVENWWPYQRPTFVSPPFAGYVSGHSTFSRAAAEVLTMLTGDAYFPGGMGEFHAPKDSFLVFEDGPSVDMSLQWAKYRDASDQCSLSRIWGGIHPPMDDIRGRLMGIEIGVDAFNHAITYMGFPDTVAPAVATVTPSAPVVTDNEVGTASFSLTVKFDELMDTTNPVIISFPASNPTTNTLTFNTTNSGWMSQTTYIAKYDVVDASETITAVDVAVSGGVDKSANAQEPYSKSGIFAVDTRNPVVTVVSPASQTVTSQQIGLGKCTFFITFDENMDMQTSPVVSFPVEDPTTSLTINVDSSYWVTPKAYKISYDVANIVANVTDIDMHITTGEDAAGNNQVDYDEADKFSIDIDSLVSVADLAFDKNGFIKVYPNPNKGEFLVELTNDVIAMQHNARISVYDMLGHRISNENMAGKISAVTIKESGVYFIQVEAGELISRQRVVVY